MHSPHISEESEPLRNRGHTSVVARVRRSSASRRTSIDLPSRGGSGHRKVFTWNTVEMKDLSDEENQAQHALQFATNERLDWDVYRSSSMLSDAEIRLLQRLYTAPVYIKVREYEQSPGAYNAILFGVCSRVREEKMLRFVLGELCALLDIGTLEVPWRRIAREMLALLDDKHYCPYRSLLGVLHRYDRHREEIGSKGVTVSVSCFLGRCDSLRSQIVRLCCHIFSTLLSMDQKTTLPELDTPRAHHAEPLGLMGDLPLTVSPKSKEELLIDFDSEHSKESTPEQQMSTASLAVVNAVEWALEKLGEAEVGLAAVGSKITAAALGLLRGVLACEGRRGSFFRRDRLHLFSTLLRQPDPSVQYSALMCIWLASFDKTRALSMRSPLFLERVVALLTERWNARAKVIRLVLAILKNLSGSDDVAHELLDLGVTRLLERGHIARMLANDAEAMEDAKTISKALENSKAILSTFDHYSSEVMTGHLQWSPAHRLTSFWRENGHRFLEKNAQLIRKLLEVIEIAGSDGLSIAVACHDLGQLFSHCPILRRSLDRALILRIKKAISALMIDEDAEIKTQALYCLQKLVLSA